MCIRDRPFPPPPPLNSAAGVFDPTARGEVAMPPPPPSRQVQIQTQATPHANHRGAVRNHVWPADG
eukprot:6985217-Prorocentrum_lima.AAC.1